MLWSWLMLNVFSGFPLPFVCVLIAFAWWRGCCASGYFVVFLGLNWGWSPTVRLLKRCRLIQVEHRAGETRKEQKKKWIDWFCCMHRMQICPMHFSLFPAVVWISVEMSPVRFPLASLFSPASVFFFSFSDPWCSTIWGATMCPTTRGQPCTCLSFYVFENRKIMPKVCLCIGGIVCECGEQGALILRCYILSWW